MKRILKKYTLPALILFLIVGQFFKIDKTNPPIDESLDFIAIEQPNTQIAQKLKAACYDCHSHTTKYPWYTDVAPISWWGKRHINVGRKKLNFSTWGEYSEDRKAHKLEECIEYTEKNWMPLGSYKLLHPEAKLSDKERDEMIAFFKSL